MNVQGPETDSFAPQDRDQPSCLLADGVYDLVEKIGRSLLKAPVLKGTCMVGGILVFR